MEEREAKLKEIETKLKEGNIIIRDMNFGIMVDLPEDYLEDHNWLITELKEAWERERKK